MCALRTRQRSRKSSGSSSRGASNVLLDPRRAAALEHVGAPAARRQAQLRVPVDQFRPVRRSARRLGHRVDCDTIGADVGQPVRRTQQHGIAGDTPAVRVEPAELAAARHVQAVHARIERLQFARDLNRRVAVAVERQMMAHEGQGAHGFSNSIATTDCARMPSYSHAAHACSSASTYSSPVNFQNQVPRQCHWSTGNNACSAGIPNTR